MTNGKKIDLTESAAGEEDPGASLDVTISPGDEPPPGTPGEDVCPSCGGSGRSASGECPVCRGTGKVTSGIGGA